MAKLQAQYVVSNNEMLSNRIPADTLSNISLFYANLKSDPALMNEFLTDMIDKVALQSVIRQSFNNPLAVLKSGTKPLGRFVELIHSNPVKAEAYDPNATSLLTVRKPDVATEYFQINRQDKYPITLNEPQIKQAFSSWEALQDLMNEIVNGLYTGSYIDEWTLMKQLFQNYLADGKLITVENNFTDNAAGAKGLFKGLKTYSKAIASPSTTFNAYSIGNETNPRVTWADPKDQVILVRDDVLIEMDIEYLAGVFNLSKVEPDKQIISIPNFGFMGNTYENSPIQAIICDRAFIKVYDDLAELRNFDNPETLNLTYFYHVWQTMGLSNFASHVAIIDPIEYVKTTDTDIVAGKVYYTRTGTDPNYVYTKVADPKKANIDNYYEMKIK